MVYKYIIDNGDSYEMHIQRVIYSNVKFSHDEFVKIIRDTLKKLEESMSEEEYEDEVFFEEIGWVVHYLIENDDRFFYLDTEKVYLREGTKWNDIQISEK